MVGGLVKDGDGGRGHLAVAAHHLHVQQLVLAVGVGLEAQLLVHDRLQVQARDLLLLVRQLLQRTHEGGGRGKRE